jgi:hypothetical protein
MMTISEEAKELRAEIAKLRPDKHRRYPEELRRRILAWVNRAEEVGMYPSECSEAIGVKSWRFTMWRKAFAKAKTKPKSEALALVEIEAPTTLPIGTGLALVAPSGHRVEGLTIHQVATLLRELE